MSNHPYRQRVPQGNVSSVPSSATSPDSSNYHSPNPEYTATYSTTPGSGHPYAPVQAQGQNLVPGPSSTASHSSGYNSSYHSPVSNTPYPMNDPMQNQSTSSEDDDVMKLHSSINNLQLNESQNRLDKPYYNESEVGSGIPSYMHTQNVQNTPPPVFNNSVASPPSNPLSATSSVTNLNINGSSQNLDSSLMNHSRSESNLLAPKQISNHNRSVSSTSSFFDRSTDNISMVDFNQNLITQALGDNSSSLMPRIKTIELYRKNARKSNDPTVLFQYAQYMLQTALLLDKDGSNPSSIENSPMRGPADRHSHKKSKSSNSFDLSGSEDSVSDKRLRKSLLKEAEIYLRKLSDKGYVDAQYLLADAFSSGALGRVENKESFLLFQVAAKHGHIESAYRTSYCYEEGLGTGRDARKAVEYLKMAASKNHPAAMYKLGVYSFYGRMGLPQNDVNTKKMGIKWLTRASNVSNELIAAAPYELGKIYFHGFKDIVIEDKKYALELYSQAAALGHVESSAILGHYYEIGEIVPQDSNLSIHYYTQAALGGDPNSMLAMCAWYLVGNDPYLPKDENESFEWAKRAAMCNLAKGQFALANFYDKGIGCEKNPEEAQKWYTKAAENGDDKAISRLKNKELANKLQKQMKKKKSSNALTPNIANNLNFDSKSTDKDCVIM